jgi:hypothetical protein
MRSQVVMPLVLPVSGLTLSLNFVGGMTGKLLASELG